MELAVVCQGSVPRVCQGFTYNLKLAITIEKTEKSKIIFHSESGGAFLVENQVSFMKDLDCRTVFSDSYSHNSSKTKNLADPTFPL